MTRTRPDMTSKATALVGNHSYLATLLAVLCLVFATNYFLVGPGSDGGSGLGGTGKFGGGSGGESGFGGTGKTPDSGSGMKLGANDQNGVEDKLQDDDLVPLFTDYLAPDYSPLEALHAELAITPKPEFDVTALRLSPDMPPVPAIDTAGQLKINDLVASIEINIPVDADNTRIDTLLQDTRNVIVTDTLVASLDILNSLILAETEVTFQIAEAGTVDNDSDAAIRHRIAVPVRPERPDRFTVPTRIKPIQRVDVPAPPPVRPMRTLSTLLNR